MSLQKALLAILILTIASTASSQYIKCGENPLMGRFGITTDFLFTNIVPGIEFCKSLQNKEICCDAKTVNGFQARADSLLERLTSAVGKRDKSLIDIRKNVIPGLNGKLQSMKQASVKAVAKLQASLPDNALLMGMVQVYGEMATTLTENLSAMRSSFTDFQKSRSTCIIDIVKIQAAAWCLACDPDHTSNGVSDLAEIEFSANLKQTLTDSCYNYFSGSAKQSMIFSINLIASSLSSVTDAMNKIAKGDPNGATEFMTAISTGSVSESSMDESSLPISFPENCNADECEWIASTLFHRGKVVESILSMGGAIGESSSSGSGGKRMLAEAEPMRVLPSGSWDPDTDEAGVKVTFEDNPGNVDNNSDSDDNSAVLFKNIIGGLVVLFTVLFI